MPDMPPEFYIPAFGALLSALGILAQVIKVLWKDRTELSTKVEAMAVEEAKTITLNTEALRGSTDAMVKLAMFLTETRHRAEA